MDTINTNVSVWQSLGFVNLQKLLDEQGIKISENATQGSANRKELSSKTKEFRKLENDEKLEQLKPLLKLYQQEIDNLTTRTKFAESCFLSMYKQLAEAPDPLPLIEMAVTNSAEIEQLRKKNAELTAKLDKQADYTALKRQVEGQDKLIQQRVLAKETELAAYWDERSKNWKAKEHDLETSLAEHKAEVAMLQSRSSDDTAPAVASKALENELVRAQTKIVGLESRVVDLRSEIEQIKGSRLEGTQDLEAENSVLLGRLDQVQQQLESCRAEADLKCETLQNELETVKSSLTAAQKQIAGQSDYDQIRKELVFLRQVEFGDIESSNEASDILQKKNAKLQDDLKNLRIMNGKLTTENDGLQQSIGALQTLLKQKSQMIDQLEGDLSTMSRDETFSTISGWTAIPRRVSPASSIRGSVRGADSSSHIGSQLGQASAQASAQAPAVSSDMLHIVTQQRDRFKDKVQELEEDLHRCKNMVTSLKNDGDALKRDNLELYSQVRKDKPRNKGVYDDELASFHTLKSFELDRNFAGSNAVDQAIFTVLKKAITDKTFRYGISAWAVLSHILLLWLAL